MKRWKLVASAAAISGFCGAATAADIGASAWDEAAALAGEKDLPVLLELGTEW